VLAVHSGWRLDAKDNHAQDGTSTGRFNINAPLRDKLGIAADVSIVGVLAQIERAVATPGTIDVQALHEVELDDRGQPLRLQRQGLGRDIERRCRMGGAIPPPGGSMPRRERGPGERPTPRSQSCSSLLGRSAVCGRRRLARLARFSGALARRLDRCGRRRGSSRGSLRGARCSALEVGRIDFDHRLLACLRPDITDMLAGLGRHQRGAFEATRKAAHGAANEFRVARHGDAGGKAQQRRGGDAHDA
jgi:hypothetical protein